MLRLPQACLLATVVCALGVQAVEAQTRRGNDFDNRYNSNFNNNNFNNNNSNFNNNNSPFNNNYQPISRSAERPGSVPMSQQDRMSVFRGLGYQNYHFAGRSHVETLSQRLYEQANAICWEMHDHYDRNQNYHQVYREMYEIKQLTKDLHEMIRREGFRSSRMEDRISRELRDLDRRFQNFQFDVRNWQPNSRDQPRFGLASMIYECEDTLHQLMDDYGVRSFGKWEKGRPSRPGFPVNNPGFPTPRR